MSNAVLPALAGLKYPVTRVPMWSGKVQTAVSGKETRLNYWSYPRWRWTIGYEVLRNSAGYTDLQQLVGFYNARYGQFDDWLFSDPDDNATTGQIFGVGNGAQSQFVLVRSFGGFDEPIGAVNALTSIVQSDWQGTRTLTTSARTNAARQSENFSVSPWGGSGVTVTINTVTAPDGNTTGDTLAFTVVNANILQTTGLTAAPSTTYVFSVWLRGTAGQTITMRIDTNGTGGLVDLAVTLTASFARYSVTLTTAGSASGFIRAWLYRATGDASSVFAWGAQVETGATATGYLPTTTSAVTAADYSLSGNVVTLPAPLATGGTLTWTGTFYWRVRWDDMDFEMEKMMAGLWSSADVSFTSVK